MIGTLGNPNFASAMLAILFVLSISGIMLKEIALWYKVIAAIASFISVVAIIKSNSRQGLLVIGISIMFYLTVYTYLKSKKLGSLIGFVSLALSFTAILGMLQSGPLSALLYKDSVSVRGFYWRAGLEMFKSNWLTGIGVDRYEYYFKQFREPQYSLRYGYEITSSNAHNTFIQFFATSGIVVGLSYILILGYIFYSILAVLTRLNMEDQKKALGLLSGWVGFQSQSLISIDNIGVSIWGWVLSGSLLGLILNYKKTKDKIGLKETTETKLVKIDLFQPIVSFIAMMPVIIAGALLLKSETATFLTRSNALSTNQINKEIALQQARNVLGNPLSDPRHKLYVSISLYDLGYQNEAEENLRKLVILDPRNIDFLRTLLVIESKNNNTLQQIEIRKKIQIYDPWNVENYLELCKLYLNIGENGKALELKKKIQLINPNSEFSTNVEKLFLNE
jgi:tetratricopeptide (TPR) repeat protein